MTEGQDYSFLKTFPYTMTYSMPRTGTTTVMHAVSSTGIPCHRCHKTNVREYHLRDMPTITLVRDPIARYLSWLLEQMHADPEFKPEEVSEKDMQAEVEENLEWFDEHFRQITGVNVYGTKFVKSKGWNIYSIRALVLKTDRINDVLKDALLEFLPPYFPDADYGALKIDHLNSGEERFGKDYQRFVKETKFDKKWLQKVYGHRFCKNFFLATEIQEYYKRWSRP